MDQVPSPRSYISATDMNCFNIHGGRHYITTRSQIYLDIYFPIHQCHLRSHARDLALLHESWPHPLLVANSRSERTEYYPALVTSPTYSEAGVWHRQQAKVHSSTGKWPGPFDPGGGRGGWGDKSRHVQMGVAVPHTAARETRGHWSESCARQLNDTLDL